MGWTTIEFKCAACGQPLEVVNFETIKDEELIGCGGCGYQFGTYTQVREAAINYAKKHNEHTIVSGSLPNWVNFTGWPEEAADEIDLNAETDLASFCQLASIRLIELHKRTLRPEEYHRLAQLIGDARKSLEALAEYDKITPKFHLFEPIEFREKNSFMKIARCCSWTAYDLVRERENLLATGGLQAKSTIDCKVDDAIAALGILESSVLSRAER